MSAPTFGPRQVDALQELATIGCGAALTALAKLTNLRLDLDVPEAWVGAGPGAIATFLGGLGGDLIAVAVQPVLLVGVGDEVVGLPIAKVHGAAQVRYADLDRSQGGPLLAYDGELVPVHDLAALLGFAPAGRDERAVVVAEGADGRIGLAVDALLGQQEAVLKPLGTPLGSVPGLSAVTVLGNGRPIFILDVPRLLAA